MARKGIPMGLRWRILQRDGFACRYCGARPGEHDKPLHIDHVLAVKLGGTNDPSNLVAACEACNIGKSAKHLHEAPPMQAVPLQPKAIEVPEPVLDTTQPQPHSLSEASYATLERAGISRKLVDDYINPPKRCFASRAEWVEAIKHPAYRTDKNYRAEVEHRARNTPF